MHKHKTIHFILHRDWQSLGMALDSYSVVTKQYLQVTHCRFSAHRLKSSLVPRLMVGLHE